MCGILGAILHNPSEPTTALAISGMDDLQKIGHRGQESSGICNGTNNDPGFYTKIILGPPEYLPRDFAAKFPCWAYLAQVRYGTSGQKISLDRRGLILVDSDPTPEEEMRSYAQPMVHRTTKYGQISLVHNGNLTNDIPIKRALEEIGFYFKENGDDSKTCDTKVLLYLLAHFIDKEENIVEAIRKVMMIAKGAYSCIVMVEKEQSLYAFRDKKGFRPLEIFKTPNKYMIASETVAMIGNPRATHEKMVNPGEIVKISNGQLESFPHPKKDKRHAYCSFEYIYLMSPETIWNGTSVSEVRQFLGGELFKELHPEFFKNEKLTKAIFDTDIDLEKHPLTGLVSPVPESGIIGARGYFFLQNMFYPNNSYYWETITKNKHAKRTFIESNQPDREAQARLKYLPHFKPIKNTVLKEMLKKDEIVWLIYIDDSKIRGTTAKYLIKSVRRWLKELFKKEKLNLKKLKNIKIGYLLTSPPCENPCYMGIDTPTKEELIANQMSLKEIREFIDADLLGYLSLIGARSALARAGEYPRNFCYGCFKDGKYPYKIKASSKTKIIL